MFVINAGGKNYRFETLEAAKAAAEDVFKRRGIVVAIVEDY